MKQKNWKREFSIEQDGFYGQLFEPGQNDFPGKALLVLGGAGMPYQATLDAAEAYREWGITALAVGYFGVPGAPKTIKRVPIEYVEHAADFLHQMGADKVIAIGLSKGAELALISAALLPQINGVIALSPSARANMGLGAGISWIKQSSWTYGGRELPYAYAPYSGARALWNTLRAGEINFYPVYDRANQKASQDSLIPVERIQGPVLVAAAETDSMWPSAEACRRIGKRLEDCDFRYPHRELIYKYASHMLLPFENSYGKLFRMGRKFPKRCHRTMEKLRGEILAWLRQ